MLSHVYLFMYGRRSSAVYNGTISFEAPTSSPSVERLSVSRGFLLSACDFEDETRNL